MLDSNKPSGDPARSAADQYTELAALAGGLAHEIKNPLSTIRLNMELLAEDFVDSERTVDRRALAKIQLVQSECTRLENLLNDFLRFARLGQLHLEPADLNAEITRALDLFQPTAEESQIDVIRYLDPELPAVKLDREPFQAALWNLILNAQQAMTDGGQLVVRTRQFPARRGAGFDRYRLRHRAGSASQNVRGVLFHEIGRQRVGFAHGEKDCRSTRRPHRRGKRSRARHQIHHRTAHAAAVGKIEGRCSAFCGQAVSPSDYAANSATRHLPLQRISSAHDACCHLPIPRSSKPPIFAC